MSPAVHDVAHLRFTLRRTQFGQTFTVTPWMAASPKLAETAVFSGPVPADMAHQLRALADAIEGVMP